MSHIFSLLQAAELTEKTAEVAKDVVSGNSHHLEQFIEQGINLAVSAGKSILIALVIYLVGRFVIKLINKVVARVLERRNVELSIQTFLKSFVNILLTVLLIITVVSALGVDTTSFAALLASVGLAAGMALSGNLQNVAGGLIILLFRPYRVGDFIEAQGVLGVVKEIQILHTIVTTVDNKEICLPNGALSNGNITNYSKEPLRRVDLTVGVEYGEDIDKVREVLNKLFAADSRILQDPAPFVALGALSASSVDITIRLWVNGADYWDVFFDMNEKIYKTFNAEKIGFPFPQLTVHQA